MKKKFISLLILGSIQVSAQVGVNTDSPNATLEVHKSNSNEIVDGLIIPKLSKTELNQKHYSQPSNEEIKFYGEQQKSTLVYVTDSTIPSGETQVRQVTKIDSEGFYYFNGTEWVKLSDSIGKWDLNGNYITENIYNTSETEINLTDIFGNNIVSNLDTNYIYKSKIKGNIESGNFLGSTNNEYLAFKTKNEYVGLINSNNISFGKGAFSRRLNINAAGVNQTTAHNNNIIAIGNYALTNNNGGNGNIAIGAESLISNTTGNNNIAIGAKTLQRNTINLNTIAIGFGALQNYESSPNLPGSTNIISANNTSIGVNSSRNSINVHNHTAVGMGSSQFIKKGNFNTAIGASSFSGSSFNQEFNYGSNNTAVGYLALPNPFSINAADGSGSNNTAIGYHSGMNVVGSNNIFIGYKATLNEDDNAVLTQANSNRLKSFSNTMNIGNILFGNNILLEGQNYLNSTAFIGIGTHEPQARLHVKGINNTEVLRLENLATGSGTVLVIDNDGNVRKSTMVASKNNQEETINQLNQKIATLEETLQALQARLSALENANQ